MATTGKTERKCHPAAAGTAGLPLTPRSPAGEVVLAYVREQVAAISRYDPLIRRDAPDAVHQMREIGRASCREIV